MKVFVYIALLALILLGSYYIFINYHRGGKMELTSSAFQNNQPIPSEYTCDGQGIMPPLAISQVPTGAKSLALIIDDPDASSGDFVHYVAWNIDPTTTVFNGSQLPNGAVIGFNSAGKFDWVAPCPPSGTHHYQFNIYALDTQLDLAASAAKLDLLKAFSNHILAQTTLVGLYQRTP